MEIMAKYRQYQVYNTGELSDVGKILLDTYPEARVFAFFGEMGAGKTVFIKKICSLLGVTDLVSSPSFPIVNHYISESGQSVYHFDFYRIKSLDEVYDLGYEDYFYSGNYCFIEWPERLKSLLPAGTVKVEIKEQEGRRIISF